MLGSLRLSFLDSFPSLLKSCAHSHDLPLGLQLHALLHKLGCLSHVHSANSLISMYGKCACFHHAQQVFDEIPQRLRNPVSWSCIIGACSLEPNPRYQEGISLFWRMLNTDRVPPTRGALLNAMACVRSCHGEADSVWDVVIACGLHEDASVRSAGIGMYARCGRVDLARRLFDGMSHKDMVMWASMIQASALSHLSLEAIGLFRMMLSEGVSPDSVTLLGVIRACSALSSFHHALSLHGMIIVRGVISSDDNALATALVDLYVKCGSLVCARRVFDGMQVRNLISWSVLISGYAMHGLGREALYVLNEMKASFVKPDHITFVSVLSACSRAGLVDEGWKCFNSMVKDFGVVPQIQHYACMVDLFGRAGKLEEALDFIRRMPIRPDASVWGSLLGACRIHSNVDLAAAVAKELMNLDPHNSGRYVLLSNIYASSGKITEADGIRKLMKNREVRKIAGYTIVDR